MPEAFQNSYSTPGQATTRVITPLRQSSTQRIYIQATSLCLETGLWEEAWEWVQENKTRRLSDFLGLGSTTPYFLLEKINSDEITRELLQRELGLGEKLREMPSEDRLLHRLELEQLGERMETYPRSE
jgi:hypothetical protein